MALKFTSVAYVILQVTKKITQEKRQKEQTTQKNKLMNNFVITESEQSHLFLWLLTYLIYQHINLISSFAKENFTNSGMWWVREN